MWVQYSGYDCWIGLTFQKPSHSYLWVDYSSSVFQNAWVIRQNRRYIKSAFDCGVAFKNYLSVTDCSHKRKWICKRTEDCAAGRYGETCEQICHKCDDGTPCNPHTGLCGDSVFCSTDDPTFTCEKGILIGGRCSAENGWLYWHGNCYYINKKERNWLYARDMCRKFSDTDLLWITSTNEKDWLGFELPIGSFWTGLHGDRFCTHLQWSYNKVFYSVPEWLHKRGWKSLTFTWRCCMQLDVSSGHIPRTSCYKNRPSICKKREEESLDFRKFDGYYLVGAKKDPERVVHSSFPEAFQHCRFKRNLCSGVQRIKDNFITFLAQRLVRVNGSSSYLYTAYLKTACSPGYYGPLCDHLCTCNGTYNCNPLNGECAENEQCNEEYIASECEGGVINLKCPSDPGWWYWKGSCYYIETVILLTWDKAKDFCLAYHGAKLLPPPSSLEEQNWLTSIIKDFVWIGTENAQIKSVDEFRNTCGKSAAVCTQMDENGTLSKATCSSLAAWGCKKYADANMFWEYPGKMIILPLGNITYADKEHAKAACLLEEKCTGISYWKNEYVPVSGKELILTGSKHYSTYMKTACNEGYFGVYCQKCLECPKEHPCNRLTGKCAGEVTCRETSTLSKCEIKLESKYCYHSWTYYNEHCYYIPQFGLINKSDAEYMCSHFEKAQLLHLSTVEEKDWLSKATQKRIWLRGVGSAFQPKVWLQSMNRIIKEPVELCLQLDPVIGLLMSASCSSNASWICEAPLASKQVDAPYKWWVSMIISLIISSVVTIATVVVTFKLGFWVPEKANEVKPQPL